MVANVLADSPINRRGGRDFPELYHAGLHVGSGKCGATRITGRTSAVRYDEELRHGYAGVIELPEYLMAVAGSFTLNVTEKIIHA